MARAAVPAYAGMPRLNLMPRVEVARRERESLTRRWVWVALGAIVLTLLIIAGAFTVKFFADQRLVAEQARTNDLLVQLSALSEVSQALATEQELTQFRADAMAADFAWAPVIGKVTGILPAEVTLTGFDLTSAARRRPTHQRGSKDWWAPSPSTAPIRSTSSRLSGHCVQLTECSTPTVVP